MQISIKKAIEEKFVTKRDGTALNVTKYLGHSSIDVTIRTVLVCTDNGGAVLDKDGIVINGVSISSESDIEPQETVCLISEERINVPPGYVAYVFLKNRFSQLGLLALNTGIVDGGFNGPISTLLTNISSQKIDLRKENEGKFFRIVFHKIEASDDEYSSTKQNTYPYEKYLTYKAKELSKLPRFFQNPQEIKKQIEQELNQKALNFGVLKLGLIIGMAGLLMILVPPLTKITSDLLFGYEPLSKSEWESKNDELHRQIDELKSSIDRVELKIEAKKNQDREIIEKE